MPFVLVENQLFFTQRKTIITITLLILDLQINFPSSKQCFEGAKLILMLPSLLKKDTEKEQQLICQLIPKQVTKPKDIFFLRGELFIDLNTYENCRVSNLNFFKQVRSIVFSKELGTLYTEYRKDNQNYDSHETASYIMKNNNNEDVRTLADRLVEHGIKQNIEIQVKNRVLEIASQFQQAKQISDAKIEEFQRFRKHMIESLPKDRYFYYVDIIFDYQSKSKKIIGNGINELFCKLLGSDIQKIQEIYMRKGILEFIESNSRIKVLNHIMQMANNGVTNGEDKIFEGQLTFLTLDDIQIDSKFEVRSYSCKSNDPFKPFFHENYQQYLTDRVFIVTEVLINSFDVKKINSIRLSEAQINSESGDIYLPNLLPSKEEIIIEETNCFETESKIEHTKLEQTEQSNPNVENLRLDIPYQAQSQYFVDLFYKNSAGNFGSEQGFGAQKPCGYRHVNLNCVNQQ